MLSYFCISDSVAFDSFKPHSLTLESLGVSSSDIEWKFRGKRDEREIEKLKL